MSRSFGKVLTGRLADMIEEFVVTRPDVHATVSTVRQLIVAPALEIQLLGGFQLRAGGAQVTTVELPRLQALLVYLLLHQGVPHTRQHLAFLLWPDSTESQARTNLRTLLHRLRQALPDADRLLQIDAQTVQWRPDVHSALDVADFERALAQADLAEQRGDQLAAREALAAAVRLYHGDLLPGWYDDWLLAERERLRQRLLAGLERLIHLLKDERVYSVAIGYAQRLLRHDPLYEAAYQHLMRLHALNGDRASALRLYTTCVATLERELGVEPSQATREVYEQIRHTELKIENVELRTDSPQNFSILNSQFSIPQHNLRIPLTSFIGREREAAEVTQLIAKTRLLTLTGAGGCGKTRLALTTAAGLLAAYPDGVWLVELAALTDAALAPHAVAAALGVREEGQRPLIATLVEALRPKRLLLVLDNCEHLIAACAELAQTLLSACPRLQILATSREALGLAGETAWCVPSLELPPHIRATESVEMMEAGGAGEKARFGSAGPSVAELMRYEAVRLFVDRATAALPTFALTPQNALAVAHICHRLDGIPLAIELAAARVRALSVEQAATRLDDCLRLLTAGSRAALPRHQTLRATIDWSYDLLSELERAIFRRLAVFAGGWSLEAAEVVCGTPMDGGAGAEVAADDVFDLLARLVDKSLVVVETRPDATMRYRLLEPIRQYGQQRLRQAHEAEAVRQRHAEFFLALAEAAEPRLWGAERVAWLSRLEAEDDNMRAALAWSLEELRIENVELRNEGDDAQFSILNSQFSISPQEIGLRLAAALWWFWFMRYRMSEGRSWLTQTIERRFGAAAAARAKALPRAGIQAWYQSDYSRATALCAEGLALARELGDRHSAAAALHGLGLVALDQGDTRAAELFEESLALARALGDRWGVAWSLLRLGQVEWWLAPHSDVARAAGLFGESLALFRQVGDNVGIAQALYCLGLASERQDDLARAGALCSESLAVCREWGDKSTMIYALYGLGQVALRQGDYERATALNQESLVICHELGDKRGVAKGLESLASVAGERGQSGRAARLLGAAAALRDTVGYLVSPGRRAGYDRMVGAARARLSADAFAAAWAEGRALSFEQAIAMALRAADGPASSAAEALSMSPTGS
jgi:predicted ATPase/DNA-binding SARP family transcriptional activator